MSTIILSIVVLAMAALQTLAFIYAIKFIASKQTKKDCCKQEPITPHKVFKTKKKKQKAETKPTAKPKVESKPEPKPEQNVTATKTEEEPAIVPLTIKQIEEYEKLRDALIRSKGILRSAAKRIRMPYSSFCRKVQFYGLSNLTRKGGMKRLERIARYRELRNAGKTLEDARDILGVCNTTACRYEGIYQNM